MLGVHVSIDASVGGSLANSPTRQLPKFPNSQLASLSAADTDVMMQTGFRHHVICCLCATRGRLVFVKEEGPTGHRGWVGPACA